MAVLTPFKSRAFVDYLFDFSKGVNSGIDYILLPKNQLAHGVNTTVRGALVGPRPCYRKIALESEGYTGAALLAIMEQGRFQGAAYYKPDSGNESLMASISGHLYNFVISGNTATVSDVSIPGDLNDPDQPRNWLWQAEKWMIVTDGTQKVPEFYDGTTTVRSNYGSAVNHTATNIATFVIPALGVDVNVNFSDVTGLSVGDVLTLKDRGLMTVQTIVGNLVTLNNAQVYMIGTTIPIGTEFSWTTTGLQLPPGRMGTYGMGRVWMSLVDGKQFVAGDISGGASGTVALSRRDAVLQITENLYLKGGGFFSVPGVYGDIRAMIFAESLDRSLGTGPLQILTPHSVFTCNAPMDRLTWQDVTNPILTESAKGGGGLSQWSTVNSNSDIVSRSINGIRSLILARREFNTWGNVPISREVQTQLDRDSQDLLGFTSAVVFDNRLLMTTEGEVIPNRGVIWKRATVINHDPYSTLQGKADAVYDAVYWQGINIFQLVKGDFAGKERCFAFTLNRKDGDKIEIYEILQSSDCCFYDDVDTRIIWSWESPVIDFGQSNPTVRERLRLGQAEIGVHDLRGKVTFSAFFRPEFWPCWVPWATWEECSSNSTCETSPSFRPNMGLPEPSADWFDYTTNRPLREGYFFQVKLVVEGHCKITSFKVTADSVPQPIVAKPVCTSICPSNL